MRERPCLRTPHRIDYGKKGGRKSTREKGEEKRLHRKKKGVGEQVPKQWEDRIGRLSLGGKEKLSGEFLYFWQKGSPGKKSKEPDQITLDSNNG